MFRLMKSQPQYLTRQVITVTTRMQTRVTSGKHLSQENSCLKKLTLSSLLMYFGYINYNRRTMRSCYLPGGRTPKLTDSTQCSLSKLPTVKNQVQPIEKVYLRSLNSSQSNSLEYLKSRHLQKRPNKILTTSNLTKYHIQELKKSTAQARTKTNFRKWIQPLEATRSKISNHDKLLPVNKYEDFQQTSEVVELNVVDLYAKSKGFGFCMNLQTENRKPQNLQRKNRVTARTGLQKLAQQFKLLEKMPNCKDVRLAVLPAGYKTSKTLSGHEVILQNFTKYNKHYTSSIRHDQPELTSRILESLCNYSHFDIYAFIRYHVIFVTEEANNTEKSYFLANLFFNKHQTQISGGKLEHILRLIFANPSKIPTESVQHSISGITRILFDGPSAQTISKSTIFRRLEMHSDVSFALLSLLCVQ